MDTETKKSLYHSAPYQAVGTAMMSFGPINALHQHICAFHVYSQDRTRNVEAHHYCNHLSPDFSQCIIYDSDEPNAKLIGIEYIVSDKVFASLPAEEKKYWHSHTYEIESGLLQMQAKNIVPHAIKDAAEQPAIIEFYSTYGKTIHTWAVDVSLDLPLGPPNLMMGYTGDGQGPPEDFIKRRDERGGTDTARTRKLRSEYLPEYKKNEGADEWEKTGKGVSFEPQEVDYKRLE